MFADGVLFDISTAVISSVKLMAKGVNVMSKPAGQTVDTTAQCNEHHGVSI